MWTLPRAKSNDLRQLKLGPLMTRSLLQPGLQRAGFEARTTLSDRLPKWQPLFSFWLLWSGRKGTRVSSLRSNGSLQSISLTTSSTLAVS